MDTLELKACIEEYDFLKGKCVGVFSADYLPTKFSQLPCCFIANTDPSNKPGQHWTAFFINDGKEVEFFDSYGMKPQTKYFYSYIKKNFKRNTYNKNRVQGSFTTTCGQYSLCYLFFRTIGLSMQEYISIFDNKNFHENDHLIKDITDYYFEMSKPLYSTRTYNQICTILGH